MKSIFLGLLVLLFAFSLPSLSQRKTKTTPPSIVSIDTTLFHGMKWRNIGPFRGGRSVAVSGIPGNDQEYLMGNTGGGLWKTTDAGITWKNISDKHFKTSSVGDIAVSPSHPNIIYVGMGEHAIRGVMTSYGDGVYRSDDGGITWRHLGLEKTLHISDVIIHPENPDMVWVAAQGAAHGPTKDRGIFMSIDGGVTWKQTLFVNEFTGASGLTLDLTNPRVLYAAMWDHIRYPWQVRSGGPGSGIFKSADGGLTWQKLSKGLPETMGKIGISVSPAHSQRVYAVVEAEKGGVYRSDNGGASWNLVSSDRITQARSWYYMEVFADPVDPNVVYVLNAPALKSVDGGKSFQPMPVQHGDTHDLWINPDNTSNMILADDGGAEITFNGGKTWSSINNQPTAQFYRVATDNQFPYKVYGGQQDNSSMIIDSRSFYGTIGEKNWTYGPGCESAYLAFDPDNPALVLGGCYQGIIESLDMKNKVSKNIMSYPQVGLGTQPANMKYRFNWNAPIVASLHEKDVYYHAGNVLFKTMDKGISWQVISPDLTRNQKERQQAGGGPVTNEGAGGENYNTIMYVAVSPHSKGTIWVGSDDGLLHVTEDEGANWRKVEIPNLNETMINAIEVSPHDNNTIYVVSTRYKFNDFSPMVHRSTDKGKTWKKITNGIRADDFVRVVREDQKVKGLLYAGTEKGFYISSNNGDSWTLFQRNLPVVPINDMQIRDNDLVVATAGRGFWILDDLSALQQTKGIMGTAPMLITPKPYHRYPFRSSNSSYEGSNPDVVQLQYYLPETNDSIEISLSIRNSQGELIRKYHNKSDSPSKPYVGGPAPEPLMPAKKGLNRFVWDLFTAGIPGVDGVFVLGGYEGYMVPPGTYRATLVVNEDSASAPIEILPDPRLSFSMSQYSEQEKFQKKLTEIVRQLHKTVNEIRLAKGQIATYAEWYKDMTEADTLLALGRSIQEEVDAWEAQLIQPNQKTFQDVINYPNQLNAELLALKSAAEGPNPIITQGVSERYEELNNAWQERKGEMEQILNKMKSYNALFKSLQLPALIVPGK